MIHFKQNEVGTKMRYLIFDFDGTLVESFHCLVEKFSSLADEFNLRKISPQEIEKLREMSSREIITHLNIPLYKLPLLIRRVRKYLRSEILNLKPVANLPEVIASLNDAGVLMGILTSNSLENVKLWLIHNRLDLFFQFIRVESTFFSKKMVLAKTLKRYRIDRSQAVYIGDETRDIDAAKKVGIRSMAVTWGYNSEGILLQERPTYLAKEPRDILIALRSFLSP